MGANAQTTVPTFTASQILTADQQNQSARTGVPVFATTITRDAAFGGTGEKTLAEGQLCYVEGTGLQTYNGTSWVTWGTAPTTSGLELINTTTIGTAVASVTISNVFSATYDNYRIVVNGGSASAGDGELNLRLGAKTTGYKSSQNYQSLTTGSFTAAFKTNIMFLGRTGTNGNSAVADLIAPNLAINTALLSWSANDTYGVIGLSNTNDTTAYTDFTLLPASGTLTGSQIRVYGYKN